MGGRAEREGRGKVLGGLGVVFFEEMDAADVEMEGDAVGGWEEGDVGEVGEGAEGFEDVFGEGDGVEAGVGAEKGVGYVVEGPLARVLDGGSGSTYL